MTPPSQPLPGGLPAGDARLLLEQAPWMRRLARTLAHDAERAEELSQETWLRLLERPPALDRPFRGWIATVMRNLLRAERRGGARRAARERAHARTELEPSSHELVARAALQRELVQAVLELEEPYRSAILLRYFEERTPGEIAAREGLPLATVKTRLARALAHLRRRLGAERGPDGQASLLLCLARLDGPVAPLPWLPWTALTLAMNVKTLTAAALLLCAGLVVLLRKEGGTLEGGRELPLASTPRADEPRPAAALDAPPENARAELPASPVLAPEVRGEAPAPEVAAAHGVGRVLDAEGRPVGGVEIALLTRETPALGPSAALAAAPVLSRSGADGSFRYEGRPQGSLFVRSDGWTTLLAGVPVDGRAGQECVIVVAPRIALAGVVVDELGLPLEDVHVELEPPADLRARLAQVFDFSASVHWSTRSDALGRFTLDPAPAMAGGTLRARREGLDACDEPAPTGSRANLVLVLAHPDDTSPFLRGVVLDAGGAPAAAALVAYGIETTRSDEQGRFAFRLDDPESFNRMVEGRMPVRDDLLRAVKRGLLPAELHATRDAAGRPRWPTPLVLRLGAQALAIEGRVEDERGAALQGMRVWVADPQLLGARPSEGRGAPEFVGVEAEIGGHGAGWSWAESDATGHFRIDGLSEREYVVAAMDPGTLLRCEASGVAAGRRDVRMVLRGLLPRLAGRVVDWRGAPVAGATIFPMCDALETRLEGVLLQTQHMNLAGALTDENGHFELERVPEDLVYLRIQGNDVIPLEWGRKAAGGLARLAGEGPEELLIEVDRRCHFQVELEVAAEADELGVLDAQGEPMTVSEFLGNGRRDNERYPLLEGRSSTLAVGGRAATLVLYRAGAEIRRLPLRLEPGRVTILRP